MDNKFNKGSFSFGPIESDQPFDPSKLRTMCSCWDDIQIITAIEYQGETYYVEEESRGKSQTIYLLTYKNLFFPSNNFLKNFLKYFHKCE